MARRDEEALGRGFLAGLARRCWEGTWEERLWSGAAFREEEVTLLLDLARHSLAAQPPLLELDPPLHVVGDIHGYFRDLLTLLATIGLPPKQRYLFLGDYVDRGQHSVQTIVLLLTYKTLYPDSVYLLRGNHEVQRINYEYGFYKHCLRCFPNGGGERLYRQFNAAFSELPMTALVGKRMLCMHGGLSPQLGSLGQLRRLEKPLADVRSGLANDLLWADPEAGLRGWQPSPRRTSFLFGPDVVRRFVFSLGIDIVVRGHQVCQQGHRFFADRRLLTLFSAPLYDPVLKNSASVLKVHPQLVCEILIFAPPAQRRPKQCGTA